jgi:hypothetical protein
MIGPRHIEKTKRRIEMGDGMPAIREVKVNKGEDKIIRSVRVVFGPHYFIELMLNEDESVDFVLGATHHGFRADASQVNGELEQILNEVRESHPDLAVD